MKTHYQKATDEIIKAAKELYMLDANSFSKVDFRKGRKLIVKMLKTNFNAKKRIWK